MYARFTIDSDTKARNTHILGCIKSIELEEADIGRALEALETVRVMFLEPVRRGATNAPTLDVFPLSHINDIVAICEKLCNRSLARAFGTN